MNKMIEKIAIALAGIGAVNWGLVKFANTDLVSFVPAGTIQTIVYAAIAVSGGFVVYELFQKKI